MKTVHIILFSTFLVLAAVLVPGSILQAQTLPQIQTNAATNIQSASAVLNGFLANPGTGGNTLVYFQWGTTASYGNQTMAVSMNFTAAFNQMISNLAPNTTYHFRAAAQNNFGTVFGQDMVFTTSQTGGVSAFAGPDLFLSSGQSAILQGSGSDPSGLQLFYSWTCTGGSLSNPNIAQPTYTASTVAFPASYTCTLIVTNAFGNSNSDSVTIFVNQQTAVGQLLINKQVINLTSGNLVWSKSVSALPSDVLSFAITLQASGQDIHNVTLRDLLPANLIYLGRLTVNTVQNFSANITSGVNIGTVFVGQPVVVAYQAQVAGSGSFNFGSTVFTNTATATSAQIFPQSSSSIITVNKSLVYGASKVPTGAGRKSYFNFAPVIIIALAAWLYFTGRIFKFASWVRVKVKK